MRLDDHHHCKACGRVIGADDEVCSDACAARRARAASSRQNLTYFIYAMMGLFVLFLALQFVR
jgi:predicted nucleic acid-binding Zn ribbon protein